MCCGYLPFWAVVVVGARDQGVVADFLCCSFWETFCCLKPTAASAYIQGVDNST